MQIQPPLSQFEAEVAKKLQEVPPDKTLIAPLYLELPADLETPLSVYLKLRRQGPSFLLESVQHGSSVGRYSFVGIAPSWLFRRNQESVDEWDVLANGSPQRRSTLEPNFPDAFEQVQQFLDSLVTLESPALPHNWGGLVGYWGYPCVAQVESTVACKESTDGVPQASFLYSRCSVLFDHTLQRMFLTLAVACRPGQDLGAVYAAAIEELESLRHGLARSLRTEPPATAGQAGRELRYHTSQEHFCGAVEAAKEHIAAGDIFQVVLSQRLSREVDCDAVALYRALRLKNPSPYMSLLDFEDFQIIGASPEMLVKLSDSPFEAGRFAQCRPIAGTRPRGRNESEDRVLAAELLADPKERAEHIMLVDLGRNDLGRVCDFGTVEVTELMAIQNYSRVMHIESTVSGRLRGDCKPTDLVRAAFPAGTVSGAPKVRAMQIIAELETEGRGPYSGAVGTISFQGDVNTAITIRTLWKRGNRVFLQAGAGIVADSDPVSEYRETLAKLQAVIEAVELADSGSLGSVALEAL